MRNRILNTCPDTRVEKMITDSQRSSGPGHWRMLPWLSLAACGLLLNACNRNPAAMPPPRTPEVVTVTITPRPLLLTTELPGRTAPYLIAEIRPQVSGLILRRRFTEGADVTAGQVLYEIDPAPFQAALDQASASLDAARKSADRARAALDASLAGVTKQKATLVLAKANRQRFEELVKAKAVAEREKDQSVAEADVAEAALKAAEAQVQSDRAALAAAEATIQQAQAAVQTARINLDYTKIAAPIPGRIGKSTVTDGAIVTAYQPVALATIQRLDPIYVDVPQSTTDLLRLQQRLEAKVISRSNTNANQVQLILPDGSLYPLEGNLQFQDISVDATTASVTLRMLFPNPNGKLLPGMFVRAAVKEGVDNQAILIPQQAVVRDPKGNPLAMVIGEDAKVMPRPIQLDRAIKDQWLVTSGLKAGDRVMIEGFQRARPGTQVKEVPFGAAAPTNAPATAPDNAPRAK